MASKSIVRKEGIVSSVNLVIIEDSIDDLSEYTLQFLSRPLAYRAVKEKILDWHKYSWVCPLPPSPSYQEFLRALTLQTIIYEIGSIAEHGFHLEIKPTL